MLDDFFARLASEWPWSDERQWTSRGDGLTLTCTHDALGHIRVAVELRRVSRGSWAARADAVVDAGQLDGLARELRALLPIGRVTVHRASVFRDAS